MFRTYRKTRKVVDDIGEDDPNSSYGFNAEKLCDFK